MRFQAVVDAFAGLPGITPPEDPPPAGSRKFGSNGLKVHNKIFAMLSRGRLVVKLPQARVAAIVADGRGTRMPSGGREMKEWLVLDEQAGLDWAALAHEAHTYVAAQA